MIDQEKLQIMLYLIKDNMSISQIASILKMSYQEISKYLYCLKGKGYEIIKQYYANGNITFHLSKQLFEDYTKRIITEPQTDKLSLLVYSDLHLGSNYEDISLLEKLYQYSIDNNIHIHLNLGDLLEGHFTNSNLRLPLVKQVDYALEKYPRCDDILVFLLLGNHDYDLLEKEGINIAHVINNFRTDIIPLGYGEGTIEVKNDYLVLKHPLSSSDTASCKHYSQAVILRGHGHEFKVQQDTSNLVIYVPTLSNLIFDRCSYPFPGAVELTLKMKYVLIEYVVIKHLSFINQKLYCSCPSTYYVGRGKLMKESNIIYNEEENPKILRK